MSLLMDALKKAEEAKRQSEAAGKAEPLALAPTESEPAAQEPAASEPGTRGLPELPERLELLDAEFHQPAAGKPKPEARAAAPKRPAAPDTSRERAVAQNVFEAKQPAKRVGFMMAVGLATLVAAAGIGIYFWLQMQPSGGVRPAAVVARTATTQPPPAAIAPAPVAPAPAAAPASSAAEYGGRPATPVPVAAAPAPAVVAAARAPAPAKASAGAPAPTKPPAEEPESPIRITTSRLKINPQIASAYQAFQSGDVAAAQRDYLAVLKNDPKNTDALHGLAAISLQQGRYEAAENLYFKILEADPKDSAAQAGVIGLRGQVDPVQSESRLKNLIAGQPESPVLNFALGNLYAQQGRWADAQQAYFRAYSGDSDNPDYQFNLAVSLDQLHQPKLALQYYQGALAAASQRPAAFNKDQVAGRVSELQK